jgi:hypothetical protein
MVVPSIGEDAAPPRRDLVIVELESMIRSG